MSERVLSHGGENDLTEHQQTQEGSNIGAKTTTEKNIATGEASYVYHPFKHGLNNSTDCLSKL